jgi:molybdopterin converting factor small subunit
MVIDVRIATSAATGATRVAIDIPEGATARELVTALIRDGHLAAQAEGTALVAVDGQVCGEDETIAAGQDCAILLPAAGG